MTAYNRMPDGRLRLAVPKPYYSLFHVICTCKKRFLKEENYEKHYRLKHMENDGWLLT